MNDPFLRLGFSPKEAKALWEVYGRTPFPMSVEDFTMMIKQLTEQPKHTMALDKLLDTDEIEALRNALE